MGLRISRISLHHFRSYEHFELAEVGGLTVVVGPNATGKTNLLEAVQLTTSMRSFRNPKTDHLVRSGCEAANVKTLIEGDGRKLEVELLLNGEGKSYCLNGKRKRANDLRGLLPSVLFCPDDLDLVKGPRGVKRAAIDALGSQLSANYHAVCGDYEKILRQKNRYLKEEVSHAYLQSINEVLCRVGAQLCSLRVQLVGWLNPCIQRAYALICPDEEEVSVAYIPSWERHGLDSVNMPPTFEFDRAEAERCLAKAVEEGSTREHERRISLYGPQVDDIEFYLQGKNVQMFASQGQQRSIVLAFKMAEVELLRDRLGYSPVLLLDDVMSELDERRRKGLYDVISGDAQTFVTATNAEVLPQDLLAQARMVKLERGSHGQ